MVANDDPQRGISGTFVFTVKNIDVTEHGLYLNNERDYRHQVALNVRSRQAIRARCDSRPEPAHG